MTPNIPDTDSNKAAYLKAQKQRNLVIGLALAGFVVLVFFVSMARMAEGLRHDRQAHQPATVSASK